MRISMISIAAAGIAAASGVVWSQARGNPTEWPTAHGDAQHTSWVRTDAHISLESMSRPGFELQWKTTFESSPRQGLALTPGVVTSAVNLFTPLSTVAGPGNQMFAVDNDTGNLFWTRRFDGPLPASTAACPGGISGGPTRIVSLEASTPSPGRAGRASQAYSSAVGEPGAGVPIAPGRGGAARGEVPAPAAQPVPPAAPPGSGRASAPALPAPGAPPAPSPASPFPTNTAAVAAASRGGGGLFRSSGVIYAVSADGMFRTLGLVSGKEVQRPAPFLPAGSRFSDLIGVDDMIYTATSGGCGGAANGLWAINASSDTKKVLSWKSNGGAPVGSPAFTTKGTVILAIGPGPTTAGGYANAIVSLDPKTLALKDWFAMPGVEFAAAPVLLQESGKDIVAATTGDGRVLLLDGAALGGPNHATPLFASTSLAGGARFAAHSPAMWQERSAAATALAGSGPAATTAADPAAGMAPDARWLLVPVEGRLATTVGAMAHGTVSTGAILALKVSHQAGTFSVEPGWVSENMTAPLTPMVVNGVAFAVSGPANAPAALYALNGTTGKRLWQSGTTISSPVSGHSLWTGSGHVYVGTQDGTVYAFGFAMERK